MSSASPFPLAEPSLAPSATVRPAVARPDRPERSRWGGPEPVAEHDLEAGTSAAGALLEALGVDLGDESLARTPRRMAAARCRSFHGRPDGPWGLDQPRPRSGE